MATPAPDAIIALRELSHACADCKAVKKYVHDAASEVYNLVLNISNDETAANSRLHKPGLDSAGQVPAGSVQDVIKNDDGNIREQMTLILNFTDMNCDIFTQLMFSKLKGFPLPESVSPEALERLIEKTCKVTALTREGLTTRLSSCPSAKQCNTCSAPMFPDFGALSASRIVGFPMGGPSSLRDKRDSSTAAMPPYKVAMEVAYPPLSLREKAFTAPQMQGELLPWVTGWAYWDVNESSMFSKLVNGAKAENMSDKHQLIVAGPSGAADMIMQALQLFKSFNVELAVLACVAYMGNPPDHSCVEILLSAVPYGIRYNADDSADEYIKWLLQKYGCAIRTPQGGGGSGGRGGKSSNSSNSSILVLGRWRRVHKQGGKKCVNIHGQLVPLSKARALERKMAL